MSTMDRINQEAGKDPETLEREIDRQRDDIGDTLAALEQKFSPGELFDKALGYARGNGGEFANNLVNTVRANPVPTVLTAVGLVWLMAGQNRQPSAYYSSRTPAGGHIGERAREMKAGVSDRLHATGQHLSDGLQHVSESRQRLGDSLHHGADSARQRMGQARQGFDSMLQEQPLALGAIGIALGAVLGAMLPPTQREDELLGATSDRLKARASNLAREGAAEVRQTGSEVARNLQQRTEQDRREAGAETGAMSTSHTSAHQGNGQAAPRTTVPGTSSPPPL